MSGPVPKRESQRRRTNKDGQPITKGQARGVDFIPAASPDWHPLAVDLYDSLETSGQSDYFEDSDWAYARIVCEALSKCLSSSRISAQMFQAVDSAMTKLLVTEGDRRRLRLELSKAPEANQNERDAIAEIEEWANTGG